MTPRAISLSDRTDLSVRAVLLSGTQGLVRLMLMQAARDRAAGLDTAGYVTGYRGSPLGSVDLAMQAAAGVLSAAQVRFHPALNEDLAATALWGTQTAQARGEGRHQGVFGLWYGKGPGVDRSGDAFRHANLAGTAPFGGVVMAMGDDHSGESSTTVHQSEFAAIDAQIPILSPAGVQEILDYGLYGFALSRYAGVWAALKLMKDTVESTAVVDGAPDRMTFVTPDDPLPPDGLSLRLPDNWVPQEVRMVAKQTAVLAFARANGIDRVGWPRDRARVGIVASGKVWLDVTHALNLLGLGPDQGVTTFKVGQVWPLEPDAITAWARGLQMIVVVEEKRGLIEPQLKAHLFDRGLQTQIVGKSDGQGVLFPVPQTLDPVMVAQGLMRMLAPHGFDLAAPTLAPVAPALAERQPYFCAGCPHNTSTVVPAGARAGAGIGCHTMALWMDRGTSGLTQMGAEGANWVGEAPFSTRAHIFQNMGDGTFNHSGLMAIRGAVAAGVNITYKLLWNDAVAMTGGQGNDGGLTAQRAAAELLAAGVRPVVLVHDPAEALDLASFPAGVEVATRDALGLVQDRLAQVRGTSAILYVQTCAAEKRRRRKRGHLPAPDTRVFILPDLCEGCGDCGVQSNCVAIQPLDTALGRKRQIDQSACNVDLSCLNGFCPAMVTVQGGTLRRAEPGALALPDLPAPAITGLTGVHNILVTGIGGTGVVTIGAVLTQAAHIAGLGAGMIEVTGMAQKGGAVLIHCRIAPTPGDISAIRLAPGECDTLLGGDLVVAGGRGLSLLAAGRTRGVVNAAEIVTGAFTRDRDFRLPASGLRDAVAARGAIDWIDAGALATRLMGDSLYANMIILGAAWQRGLVPLPCDALEQAIRLNGAQVDANLRAFAIGRQAVVNAAVLDAKHEERSSTDWTTTLMQHSGPGLVARWRALVDTMPDPVLAQTVARNFARLLAVKDEYEVARHLAATRAHLSATFATVPGLSWHLAPPFLPGRDGRGRPRKRRFGGWAARLWPWLARMRFLRGTWADPFGHTAERRAERALITRYEADLRRAAALWAPATRDAILALADLPDDIRGFGPVKAAAMARAAARRATLWDQIITKDGHPGQTDMQM